MKSKSQKKFLIIKLSSLGDVVHALPTAHTLRRECPEAFITWVIEERYQELLHDNPDIDEVIPIRTKFWRKNWNWETLKEIFQKIKSLRKHKFDMAFDFHGLIKSGLIAMLSGARIKVGFHRKNCKEKVSSIFTNKKGPLLGNGMHVVDMHLTVMQSALNIQREVKKFPLPSIPAPKVDNFFQNNSELEDKPIIGINSGAGFESKIWDLERFAELADRITVEMNCSILLTWGPGEEHRTNQIATSMKQKCWVAPPTSINESISLYKHLSLLISCDSGPLHLCAALGIPTVSLFGPTDPKRNGAYGLQHETVYKFLSCSFCWKRKCPLGTKECMKQVTVDQVFETVRSNRNSNN